MLQLYPGEQCSTVSRGHAQNVFPVAIAFLVITAVMGGIFAPILTRLIKGSRKVYILIQQLCVLFYSITMILQTSLFDESFAAYLSKFLDVYEVKFESDSNVNIQHTIVTNRLLESFLYLFKCEFFFMSFMHTFDVHVMICKPLTYSEFCEPHRMGKYLSAGTGLCILAAIDKIVLILPAAIVLSNKQQILQDYELFKDINFGTNVFSVIKNSILNIVFLVIITKMCLKTKIGLQQSSKMNQKNNNKTLHNRLMYYSFIPLILVLLNIVSEIPETIDIFNDDSCLSDNFLLRYDFRSCFSACIFLLNSMSYYLLFFLLFPKIKNILLCRNSDE